MFIEQFESNLRWSCAQSEQLRQTVRAFGV